MRECFKALKGDLSKYYSKEELEDLYKAFEARANRAKDDSSKLYDELRSFKDEVVEGIKNQEMIKKFQFLQKTAIKNKLLRSIAKNQNRLKPLADTIGAYTNGTEKILEGSRDSFDLASRTMISKMKDGFLKKLKDNNILSLWHNKVDQMKLAESLQSGGEHKSEHFAMMGKIVLDNYEQLNKLLNSVGIFPDKLDGRMARNIHDKNRMLKISGPVMDKFRRLNLTKQEVLNLSADEWFKFTAPLLDRERAFTNLDFNNQAEVEKVLKDFYFKYVNDGYSLDGGNNIIKSITGRRMFVWKDAESELKYIEKYGAGDLYKSIEIEMQNLAQDIAYMRRFGSDHQSLLNNVVQSATKLMPELMQKENVANVLKEANRTIDMVNGKLNDSSSSIAILGGNIRAFQSMTKLGNVLTTALSDLAGGTLDSRRIYGGFLNSAFGTISDLFHRFTPEEKGLYADVMKSYISQELGGISRWEFVGDANSPVMTKLTRLNFKMNMLHGWDKANKTSKMYAMGRGLAQMRNKSFTTLEKSANRWDRANADALKAFNITSDEWDVIRQATTKMADGRGHILPETMDQVSNDTIKSLLQKEGRKDITANDINEKREDMKFRMDMYFQDGAEHNILHPSANLQSKMVGNLHAGTIWGQVARMMMQFKQYSAAIIEKPIAKLLYANGAENLYQSFFTKGKRGDFVGLAQYFGYATLLGYLGVCVDNIVKGYSPPAPTDKKTIMASVAKGGGLSFVSDVLFNGGSRMGGLLGQLAGPSLTEIANFTNTFVKDPIQDKFSTNQALHFAENQIPLIKTFYTKWALNYLIFNQMQEASNPGYIQKKQTELEANGQKFWFPQL
jgi:hypothetical protein